MSVKSLWKKLDGFEVRHKVFFFILVFTLTIIIVRVLALAVFDPTPILFGFELHHFDYGLLLLIVVTTAVLFDRCHRKAYLLLSAIAVGLVIDELWFIRGNLVENLSFYKSTIPFSIILLVFIASLVIVIRRFQRKNGGKNKKRN